MLPKGIGAERALTSEEEWITMSMKLYKGNEFPWVEVRMKEGNIISLKTPPEDQIPRGCSLHSMEPLRDWFCKGADMNMRQHFANLKKTHLILDSTM